MPGGRQPYEAWQGPEIPLPFGKTVGVKELTEMGAELPFWTVLPSGTQAFKGLAPTVERGAERAFMRAGQVAAAPFFAAEQVPGLAVKGAKALARQPAVQEMIRSEVGSVGKKPIKPTAPVAKEPWQMTKAEYIKPPYTSPAMHKYGVQKALSEGKPVPSEVLKDYPDLAKAIPKAPVAPEVTTAGEVMAEIRRIEKTVPSERMSGSYPSGKPRIIPIRKGLPLEPELQKIQNRLDELWALHLPEVPIPRAEPGMPEAGLQPSMMPEEVAAKEVRPAGKGKITQISMEDQLKLEQARQQAVQAEVGKEVLGTDPVVQAKFNLGGKKVGLDAFVSIREQTFPEYFTVKQAEALMSGHKFAEYLQKGTSKYNHVPRDVALDDLTKKFGMSADEIADRVMAIKGEKAAITRPTAQPVVPEPLPTATGGVGKPPEPPTTVAQPLALSPDEIIKNFRVAIASPESKSAWELTQKLRTAERGKRIAQFHTQLNDLLNQGTDIETALNEATQKTMAGKLPSVETGINSIPELRYALFDKLEQSLKGYELISAKEALTNALAGKPIPNKVVTLKGGTARKLLEKVFGKEVVDAIENPSWLGKKEPIGVLGKKWGTTPIDTDVIKQLVLLPPPARDKYLTAIKRIGVNTVDILNIPRVLQTMMDHSMILRQGGFMTAGHPVQAATKWLPKSIKAAFNDEAYLALRTQISQMRGQDLFAAADGYMGPILRKNAYIPLSQAEESFASNLVKKVPILRDLVGSSQRAATSYLNLARATIWQDFYDTAIVAKLPKESYRSMAQLINWSSGRGSLPSLIKNSGPLLGMFFYAPRWVISRLEIPIKLAAKDKLVRVEAWRQMGTYFGSLAALASVAEMSGLAHMELDPRSSDFGKLRVGNTRIDFGQGFAQWTRLLTQMTTRERKNIETGKIAEIQPLEIWERFWRGKMAPLPSLLADIVAGQSYGGEPMTLEPTAVGKQTYNRTMALAVQDFIDSMVIPGGNPAAATLGFVGAGVQTYAPEETTGKYKLPVGGTAGKPIERYKLPSRR